MKKRHECGHLGLGRYCHRCRLAEALEKLPDEASKAEAARLRLVPGKTPSQVVPAP